MSSSTSSAPHNPVIHHVVLLKVRPNVSKEELQNFYKGIHSLHQIPGVLQVSVGPTFCESDWMEDRRNGVTHALSVQLENKAALQVYQNHEHHVKIKTECIKPIVVEAPAAIDWEHVEAS